MDSKNIFLKKDISDNKAGWKEWQIQAFLVRELRRLDIMVHGDQNGAHKGRASAAMAQVTGMQKGWPDLCVIKDDCSPMWIELKLMNGRLSEDQIMVHSKMGDMVHVVYADCPLDAWEKVRGIIGIK